MLKIAGALRNHKTSHQTAMYKKVARIVQWVSLNDTQQHQSARSPEYGYFVG
jgi:hypothetical protein